MANNMEQLKMANWYRQYVQDGKFTKDDARDALDRGLGKKKIEKFIRNNPDKLKKNNQVQRFLDNYVSKNKNDTPPLGLINFKGTFPSTQPQKPVDEMDETDLRTGEAIGGTTGATYDLSDPSDRGYMADNDPGTYEKIYGSGPKDFTPGIPVTVRAPFVPETPPGQFPGTSPGTELTETTVGDATDDLGAGPTPGAGGDPPETIGLTREELEEVISGMLNPILENMPDYQNTADFDYNPNNLFEYTYKDEDGNIVTESMTIDTIEHLQDLDLQKQKNIGAERLKIIDSGINDRLAASTDYGNQLSFSGVKYTSDMQSGIRKYEADVASGVNIYRANLEAATASGVQKLKNQGAVDLQSIVNSGLAAVETIRGGYTVSGIGLQTQASETIARIQAQADKYRARRGVEGQIYGGLVAGFWS